MNLFYGVIVDFKSSNCRKKDFRRKVEIHDEQKKLRRVYNLPSRTIVDILML